MLYLALPHPLTLSLLERLLEELTPRLAAIVLQSTSWAEPTPLGCAFGGLSSGPAFSLGMPCCWGHAATGLAIGALSLYQAPGHPWMLGIGTAPASLQGTTVGSGGVQRDHVLLSCSPTGPHHTWHSTEEERVRCRPRHVFGRSCSSPQIRSWHCGRGLTAAASHHSSTHLHPIHVTANGASSLEGSVLLPVGRLRHRGARQCALG